MGISKLSDKNYRAKLIYSVQIIGQLNSFKSFKLRMVGETCKLITTLSISNI